MYCMSFHRKSSSIQKDGSDVAHRGTGETQLYEDSEKIQVTTGGQGNFEYELTHCPAYESVKQQPCSMEAQPLGTHYEI